MHYNTATSIICNEQVTAYAVKLINQIAIIVMYGLVLLQVETVRLFIYLSILTVICYWYHRLYPVKYNRQWQLRRNGGYHSQLQWLQLCARYNFCCANCGKFKPLTKDHIKPVSKGGSNSIKNIQPLCKSCNSSKGAKY